MPKKILTQYTPSSRIRNARQIPSLMHNIHEQHVAHPWFLSNSVNNHVSYDFALESLEEHCCCCAWSCHATAFN